MSLDLVTLIFGMKVRQARLEAGMTLTQLAHDSHLSPSYLTEIEKGRKYPRADKILKMAAALGKEYDDLVSLRLAPSLRYLEQTLSSTTLQRFPFEEFGLAPSDALNLLTRQPERASALLHALLEIGRRFDLTEEDLFRAALGSYKEIHDNYFPDLEEAALQFTAECGPTYGLSADQPATLTALEEALRQEYGYTIDDQTLANTEELAGYRSVVVDGPNPTLYLNNKLYARQIKFILARELGYRYLGLEERSWVSTPDKVNSFQQLLNDMRASYFGGALLMPRVRVISDLEDLFGRTEWDPEAFSSLITTYDVTPEMLLYRISELVPEFFGIKLHFLRFHHTAGTDSYQLVRQLNMNQLIVPSGIGLHEHYCRRWLSIELLPGGSLTENKTSGGPIPAGIQLSEFLESKERFLCLGFGRNMVLNPDVSSSVIVGFRVDDALGHTIRFLDDPAIPHVIINETCERCPLTAEQCTARAAPPSILHQRQDEETRQTALQQLASRAP